MYLTNFISLSFLEKYPQNFATSAIFYTEDVIGIILPFRRSWQSLVSRGWAIFTSIIIVKKKHSWEQLHITVSFFSELVILPRFYQLSKPLPVFNRSKLNFFLIFKQKTSQRSLLKLLQITNVDSCTIIENYINSININI